MFIHSLLLRRNCCYVTDDNLVHQCIAALWHSLEIAALYHILVIAAIYHTLVIAVLLHSLVIAALYHILVIAALYHILVIYVPLKNLVIAGLLHVLGVKRVKASTSDKTMTMFFFVQNHAMKVRKSRNILLNAGTVTKNCVPAEDKGALHTSISHVPRALYMH